MINPWFKMHQVRKRVSYTKDTPLLLSILFALLCLSSSVFVGCRDSGDFDKGYGYGIYSAQVKPNGTQLDFKKIVSPADKPNGITHHDHTEQLFYTVGISGGAGGIYKCDFTGANNETVLTGLTSK